MLQWGKFWAAHFSWALSWWEAPEEPVLVWARKAALLAGGQSTPLGSWAPGSAPIKLLFLDVIYSLCPAESWEDEQWLPVVYSWKRQQPRLAPTVWIHQPVLLVCPRSLTTHSSNTAQTSTASMARAGSKEFCQTLWLHHFSCSQHHGSARSPWLTLVCCRGWTTNPIPIPRTALTPLSPWLLGCLGWKPVPSRATSCPSPAETLSPSGTACVALPTHTMQEAPGTDTSEQKRWKRACRRLSVSCPLCAQHSVFPLLFLLFAVVQEVNQTYFLDILFPSRCLSIFS